MTTLVSSDPQVPYPQIRGSLNTGDLVFLQGDPKNLIDLLIEDMDQIAGEATRSHVGMIINDGGSLYLFDAPGPGTCAGVNGCYADPYVGDPDNRLFGKTNPDGSHDGLRVSPLDTVLKDYANQMPGDQFWIRHLTTTTNPYISAQQFAALRIFIDRVDGLPFPSEWVGMPAGFAAGQKSIQLFFGTYFCAELVADALELTELDRLLDGAKVFAYSAMSNVLGTITPVRLLSDAAHAAGALAVVDACQYVPHNATDVQAMGADLVAFSSHKLCGPTGIGALWGHEALLDAMPPFLGGGNMILDVRLDGFTPAELPAKFEAGTPPIVEAIGMGAAIDYLQHLGMAEVRRHEMGLTRYALDTLKARLGDQICIYGPDNVEVRGGVISFALGDVHPHDVSQVLDETNVYVRAGHHCAKPLMRVLGVNATTRASIYLYNDQHDIDALADALERAGAMFTF
jgi:hypothetical protein